MVGGDPPDVVHLDCWWWRIRRFRKSLSALPNLPAEFYATNQGPVLLVLQRYL
jgi:hypothetical protein